MLYIPLSDTARSYRFVHISQIPTLLISDPASDITSCALAVCCGAQNDPEDLPGLAHFCEHCVLLGPKTQKSVNTLQKSLAGLSEGSVNAYTMGETTCFYFQLQTAGGETDALETCLKVFAQSFEEPAFNQRYLKKEINAIDNEHRYNTSIASKKLLQGLRHLANPLHKFSRFATGDFSTLFPHAPQLRSAVSRFFKQHYKRDNFTLVLKGPHSLNRLQKLTVDAFADSQVPSILEPQISARLVAQMANTTREHETKEPEFAQTSRAVVIEAGDEVARLVFPINSATLLSRLFLEFLSTFLDVSPEIEATAFTTQVTHACVCLVWQFDIFKRYTVAQNLAAFFKYAELLCKLPATRLAQILAQHARQDSWNYYFAARCDPDMEEVAEYATAMQRDLRHFKAAQWMIKPSPSWLQVPTQSWTSVAEQFRVFAAQLLVPQRSLLIAITERHESLGLEKCRYLFQTTLKKRDAHFNFDYTIYNMDWTSEKLNSVANLALKVPQFVQNKFAPQIDLEKFSAWFSAAWRQSQEAPLGFSGVSMAMEPSRVSFDPQSHEFWHWQDSRTSSRGRGSVAMLLTATEPTEVTAAQLEVCGDICCELLELWTQQQLVGALEAGFEWRFFTSERATGQMGAVGFSVSGTCGKLADVVSAVVQCVQSLLWKQVTHTAFAEAQKAVLEQYAAISGQNSVAVATTYAAAILEHGAMDLRTLCDTATRVQLADLHRFLNGFAKHFTQCFVAGDVSRDDAQRFFASKPLSSSSPSSKGPGACLCPARTAVLGPGAKFVFETCGGSTGSKGSTVAAFWQTGSRFNTRTVALTAVAAQLVETMALTQLRTQKQLAYHVLCGQRSWRATTGVHVTVVTQQKPQVVEHHVARFFCEFGAELARMDDHEFAKSVKWHFLQNYVQVPSNVSADCFFGTILTPDNVATYLKPGHAASKFQSRPGEDLASSLAYHTSGRGDTLKDRYWHEIVLGTRPINQGLSKSKSKSIVSVLAEVVRLTQPQFVQFWLSKFVARETSARLSVWLSSAPATAMAMATDSETDSDTVTVSSEDALSESVSQIEAFLKFNGFWVPHDVIRDAVGSSGGDTGAVTRILLRYLSQNGARWRVMGMKVHMALETVRKRKNKRFAADLEALDAESSDFADWQWISDIDAIKRGPQKSAKSVSPES